MSVELPNQSKSLLLSTSLSILAGLVMSGWNPDEVNPIDISPDVYERCLQIYRSGGLDIITYQDGRDAQGCTEIFAGQPVRLSGRFDESVLPITVAIPHTFACATDLSEIIAIEQSGPTCRITAVAGIISNLYARRGQPAIDPFVVSDVLYSLDRPATMPESLYISPGEADEAFQELNDAPFDREILEREFGVTYESIPLYEMFGVSNDAQQQELLERNPDHAADTLVGAYKTELEAGRLSTITSRVQRYADGTIGRHMMAVVGGGVDEGNVPYLLVIESNGSHTIGWNLVHDYWKPVPGAKFLLEIPLVRETMEYFNGEVYSFYLLGESEVLRAQNVYLR